MSSCAEFLASTLYMAGIKSSGALMEVLSFQKVQGGNEYLVLVSLDPPYHTGVPLDTIWITPDSGSPWYGRVLKLNGVTSYNSRALVEGTPVDIGDGQRWIQVMEYENLFTVPQVFNTNAFASTCGLPGVPGPKGATGPIGPIGQQGPMGPSGVNGQVIGYTGELVTKVVTEIISIIYKDVPRLENAGRLFYGVGPNIDPTQSSLLLTLLNNLTILDTSALRQAPIFEITQGPGEYGWVFIDRSLIANQDLSTLFQDQISHFYGGWEGLTGEVTVTKQYPADHASVEYLVFRSDYEDVGVTKWQVNVS